jgi:predicted transglutaminase-like cysteine proteinase
LTRFNLFLFCLAAVQFGQVATPSAVVASSAVRPPIGMQLFCLKNPDQCQQSPQKSIELTPALLRTLNATNRAVNRAITARADFGDTWEIDGPYGDCEDYALTKRAELMDKGIPSGSLVMAYTRTRSGEGHAVLLVRTTEGDLVLDNLYLSIKPLQDTGYRIISRSNPNSLYWETADLN